MYYVSVGMTAIRVLLPVVLLVAVTSPATAQICSGPLDIVFVVDSSGSIKDFAPPGDNLLYQRLMKQFMTDIVNNFTIGPSNNIFAVVDFGNFGYPVSTSGLNRTGSPVFKNVKTNVITRNGILDDIANLTNREENTNTSAGIFTAHYTYFRANPRIDRPSVPDVMVILTDGVSTRSQSSTIPFAMTARSQGINIISIGIGSQITDNNELRQISSMPQVTVY